MSVLDEVREPRGEDVLRDAEAALKVSEAARAEEGVAHDQERPPVAERLERLSDPAVHLVEAFSFHGQSTLAIVGLHEGTGVPRR